MDEQHKGFPRTVAITAVAIGLIGGSYGIASAASGNSSSSGSSAAATPSAPPAVQPWGRQRPDETPLTDGTATRVRNAALAKVPGAMIVRVETDADGHAAYEAHLIKADGTPVTVYVDKSFDVVGVETR